MKELLAGQGQETIEAVRHVEIMCLQLLAAFGFGLLSAAIHYFTTHSTRRADRSFLATLVLLSVLIAVVTIVIGNSIARAFSLAGVLAIVRFRTVVEDIRDTTFVIFSVVAGMAVGGGFFLEPLLATPLILLAAWMFRSRPTVAPPSHGVLILRLAAGRSIDQVLEDTLRRYLKNYHLIGLSTARGGSALDASYAIQLPAAEKVFALINDLSRVDGVQGVEIKDD